MTLISKKIKQRRYSKTVFLMRFLIKTFGIKQLENVEELNVVFEK